MGYGCIVQSETASILELSVQDQQAYDFVMGAAYWNMLEGGMPVMSVSGPRSQALACENCNALGAGKQLGEALERLGRHDVAAYLPMGLFSVATGASTCAAAAGTRGPPGDTPWVLVGCDAPLPSKAISRQPRQ